MTRTERMGLWWYNHFWRHVHHVWFRWRHMKEWVELGRDPTLFPRAGKVTPADYEWAKRELNRLKH